MGPRRGFGSGVAPHVLAHEPDRVDHLGARGEGAERVDRPGETARAMHDEGDDGRSRSGRWTPCLSPDHACGDLEAAVRAAEEPEAHPGDGVLPGDLLGEVRGGCEGGREGCPNGRNEGVSPRRRALRASKFPRGIKGMRARIFGLGPACCVGAQQVAKFGCMEIWTGLPVDLFIGPLPSGRTWKS